MKHARKKKTAHPMDSQFIALGFKEAEREVTGNPFNFSDGTFKVRQAPTNGKFIAYWCLQVLISAYEYTSFGHYSG